MLTEPTRSACQPTVNGMTLPQVKHMQLRALLYRVVAGVVDTLFISRQGHFSCPCRTGVVMLGSMRRPLLPDVASRNPSALSRSLEARQRQCPAPA